MKKFLVFFTAIALVAAFTVPAMAASEWNFYGSARMQTFSKSLSKDAYNGTSSDRDTTWGINTVTSRLGMKATAGDVTGLVEVRPRPGAAVGVRHWYGEWNFGAGKLLAGQTWDIMSPLISNQAGYNDNGLAGFGENDYRLPMLRLTFGDLQIQLASPGAMAPVLASTSAGVAATGVGFTTATTDVTLPKMAVNYTLNFDPVTLKFGGGYNTYKYVVDEDTATEKTYDIDSWIAQIVGKVNFGAVSFSAVGYMAQNEANYFAGGSGTGGTFSNTVCTAIYDDMSATPGIQDVDSVAFVAILGFKASDMLAFEAGLGYLSTDVTVSGIKIEDTAYSYYVQAPVTLAPGVYFVPEIGVLDYDDVKIGGATTPQGDATYFGAKWQIDF